MYNGGLINQIPDKNLGLARNKESYTQQSKTNLKYMQFKKNKLFSENRIFVYGSFNYRLQSYPADIDSSNVIRMNVSNEEASLIIESNLKSLVKKLMNNKLGKSFADLKCGIYKNGKSIHWTPSEILKGIRKKSIPDINGEFSEENITLKEAILHIGAMIKLDMITPYMGRYVEISCLYEVVTTESILSFGTTGVSLDEFYNKLAIDTGKFYKQNKLFKVIKRIYSNARLQKDIKILKIIEPLINSNLSKLSAINSDLKTLDLLLSVNKFPSTTILNQEIQKIKFNINNILDINLNQEDIFSQLDLLYILLQSKKKSKSRNIINQLTSYFENTLNKETLDYLKSININNINQFGKKYIIL